MNNFPKKKNNNELDIYGTISFVIMFIFISIIILLIMYYNGILSMENDKNPFVNNTSDTQVADVSSDDTSANTIEEIEETVSVETLELYLPVVEVISTETIHYLEELYPNVVLKETTDAGQEYIDNIIFLGDSTTHGLKSYKMLKDGRDTNQVWTPVSGTLTLSQANVINILFPDTDTEMTIEEAVRIKKPPILIITLGVNGVSFMKEDYFKSEYIKLIENIQSVSPDTIIILQSIFPIAKSYQHQNSISIEKICNANEWIAAIASETGVKFLNTYTVLVGEDGYLPEEYQNGDGMHFNATSFEIVLNYIRTHANIE